MAPLEVSRHGNTAPSSIISGDPAGQAHAGSAVRGRVPRFRRRVDRQRRAAVDPAPPPFLRPEPAVGAQRLPAHLRRVHAARRPRGRPDRSPAVARRRHVGVCALLTRRRARRQRRDTRRRPTRPGDRGGDDGPGGTFDPHDVVSRGQRPQHGARRVGRAGGAGLRGRGVSRRRALRRAGVAVGVLRKPPGLRGDIGGDATG